MEMLKARGLKLFAAYGNTTNDIRAYAAVGIPKARQSLSCKSAELEPGMHRCCTCAILVWASCCMLRSGPMFLQFC